jgi:hypothetical protein
MAAKSGQITVTTAGTEVVGPVTMLTQETLDILLRAHPSNSGQVFVGNDGANAVSSATGMALAAGEMVVVHARDLSGYWFDSAVNGEKICWLIVDTRV